MILVFPWIIFLYFVTTLVPSILPKIMFSIHTLNILTLDIISLKIMHLREMFPLNNTYNQLVDIFTKPLSEDQFCKIRRELGMIDVHDVWTCCYVMFFLVFSCYSRFEDSNPFSRKFLCWKYLLKIWILSYLDSNLFSIMFWTLKYITQI